MKNIQDGLTPRVVQGCANLSQAARLSLLQFRLKLQKSRGRRSLAQKLDISRALSLNVFDGFPWLKIFQSWSHRLHRTFFLWVHGYPSFGLLGCRMLPYPFLILHSVVYCWFSFPIDPRFLNLVDALEEGQP